MIEHTTGFSITRTAEGVAMDFNVLRTPGAALGLGVFALLCAVMPALGLAAVLPLQSANAGALLTLALVGGIAAPFIFASIVFGALAVYLAANSLHVEVTPAGARHGRRLFGLLTRQRAIVRADVVEIALRIASRHQNLFSSEPRYTLVALHREGRAGDVIVAEDVRGQALASELAALLQSILNISSSPSSITDHHEPTRN